MTMILVIPVGYWELLGGVLLRIFNQELAGFSVGIALEGGDSLRFVVRYVETIKLVPMKQFSIAI